MSTVIAERIAWSEVDPLAWDAQAAASGSTWQSAYGAMALWRRRQQLRGNKAVLVRLRAGDRFIGHCAVGRKHGANVFRDRLLLLPEAEPLWSDAMQAVVTLIGPGRYRYGTAGAIEPPRQHEIAGLADIQVRQARESFIQAIDFGRFADWNDYWMALNGNVRRAVVHAEKIANLRAATHSGTRALRHLPGFIRSASAVRERKGALALNLRDLAQLGSACIWFGDSATLLSAQIDGRTCVAQFHARFGSDTHYLVGATSRDGPAVAWWLTMQAVRAAYDHAPKGRLVLGPFDPSIHDEAIGGGLLRWRRSCRVTDFPVATVDFERTA